MIAIFPEPYPDELLYSMLARYFVYSGHPTFKQCCEDLYPGKTRPDIEYLNSMTPDLLSHISNMEQMILQHTMFPTLRFIPSDKRQKAYQMLIHQDNRYQDHVFKPKERRRLRYCPVCVAEDRHIFGETYWHRIPQIHGLKVCPIHHVILEETDIPIYSREAGSLLPAEVYIPAYDKAECGDDAQNSLADYVAEVFLSPFSYDANNVGEYLRCRSQRYRSPSGKSIRSRKLFDDFQSMFPDSTLNKDWQIRKIFNGSRFDMVEICQVAIVLGVTTKDLLNNEDYSSEATMKPNNGRFRLYETDWEQKDLMLLQDVKKAIEEMLAAEPPIHLTIGSIARNAGISRSTLDRGKLPYCNDFMIQYIESQEEYWARKLEWACEQIKEQCLPFHKTQIRRLTNIEYIEMSRAIPYLHNAEIKELIG